MENTNETKKYILTGGPSSGKSSLILALEQKGEYCIREAAEDVIKYQQALGNKEPWLNPDFQDWILNLQIQREQRIPKEAKRAFIDRGLADGLAYYEFRGNEPSKAIKEATRNLDYEKVFLIQNLGNCINTDVRKENLEEALKLERLLEKNYETLGYKVIKIGSAPLEERADKILSYI
jgi:predicted ATPase